MLDINKPQARRNYVRDMMQNSDRPTVTNIQPVVSDNNNAGNDTNDNSMNDGDNDNTNNNVNNNVTTAPGLPLTMDDTRNKDVTVNLSENPGDVVYLVMQITGANIANEGAMEVNGRFARQFFMDGERGGADETITLNIPTNGNHWKQGENKLTFRHYFGPGYRVESITASNAPDIIVVNPNNPGSSDNNSPMIDIDVQLKGYSFDDGNGNEPYYRIRTNDNTILAQGVVNDEYNQISVQAPQGSTLSIAYLNDNNGQGGGDRNLLIAKVIMDGETVNLKNEATLSPCAGNVLQQTSAFLGCGENTGGGELRLEVK